LLLQLGGAPFQRPRSVSVGSQTEFYLPQSRQLMSTPLTALQKEEEARKKRIFDSVKNK
jgi:hypothetical protein